MLLVIFHMNGHIQDFAHKLNRKEKKKQKKKTKRNQNEHSSSCTTSHGIGNLRFDDGNVNDNATNQ